jgi:unsaturated rhamnogalacturonyl hydrolase
MDALDGKSCLELLDSAMQAVLEDCLPSNAKWNYETGLGLMAVLEASRRHFDSDRIGAVQERADALVRDDGSISGYKLDEYNVDQVNAGKLIFELWKITERKKYWNAIKLLAGQMESHPRTPSGSFWHKKIYPDQVWLDGLYMFGPFLARYAVETGAPELLDDVCAQLLRVGESMRDPVTGLYYHARDESRRERWADGQTGLSSQFWGRAVGWLSMALVDILDWVPSGHSARSQISAMAGRLAHDILQFQTVDGLWNQILDMPDLAGNYPESSASSMFCYFLFKGMRTGILDKTSCAEAARRALSGIAKTFVSWEQRGSGARRLHFNGICKVAGLGGFPYRDGSLAYYLGEPVVSDDFKGLGPFILALSESQA